MAVGDQPQHRLLRKALLHLHRHLMSYEASKADRMVELAPAHAAEFAAWLLLSEEETEMTPAVGHAERACLQGLKQEYELAIKKLGDLCRVCLLNALSGDATAKESVAEHFRFPDKGMFYERSGMIASLRRDFALDTTIDRRYESLFAKRAIGLRGSPQVMAQIRAAFKIRNYIEHRYSRVDQKLLESKTMRNIGRTSWGRHEFRPGEKIKVDTKDLELTACAMALSIRHLVSSFEDRFGPQQQFEAE